MQTFAAPFSPLSALERQRSCEAALAAAHRGLVEFWLFGYGSLMWDANFAYIAAKPARLMGWQREMSVWTALARGTPERPGLSLGLMPGGVCDGVAYQIAEHHREQVLAIVWEREMWTDVYQPTWISVQMEGAVRPALTFTVNQASRQFAGELSEAQVIDHIAHAVGERGPCRDYLAYTVASLHSLGIEAAYLQDLNEKVQARAGQPSER